MISIVIPYYNREDFLPRTLQTVGSSSYRPLELILVDNGSTDRSAEICREFAEANRSNEFHVTLAEEPQKGAARARNKGLSLCQTPFVYFFDSDDEFDPLFLETIVPMLSDDIDLLAVTFRMSVEGKTLVKRHLNDNKVRSQILASHLATPSMVFRTDFIRKIGGWDDSLRFWDDWELGVRALSHHPRMRWFTDKPFHHINVHEDSITGLSFSARIADICQTLESTYNELDGEDQLPLYYRMEIIRGQLLREKSREGATQIQALSQKFFPRRPWCRKLPGGFVRSWSASGLPGAWRIACWFC